MLNTGRRLWECRDPKGQGLAKNAPLWGETFRKAGYETFITGKWHLPDEALIRSFSSKGFLTPGFLPSSTNTRGEAYSRPALGNPWMPDDPKWKGHWIESEGRFFHSSERIVSSAIDFLQGRSAASSNNFLMYVSLNAPHDPRQAPPEFLKLYPPGRIEPPPNFLPRHPFPIDGYDIRDEVLAPFPRTPEIVQVHLQEYYAIITHMDREVGRLLDALESTGQAHNTVIIFTSDQGLAVGQHGLLGKQNLYDHSVRMPFLIAGPGIPRGKRTGEAIYMQSLYATTCEMAGIAVPPSVQFPSLLPILQGTKGPRLESVYGAYLDKQRSIREGRWKLIRNANGIPPQLFEITRDPWEQRNLAERPSQRARVRELDAKLAGLMREWNDPQPAGQFGIAP